ncbi:MAG: YitT family protein [SAR324 cluster bacterium]|nr:YitT family protein [SAR324 cluster bacterium]MBL7035289.1 YitT family protein [SAR324 cluster bacterium]
MNQLKEDFKEFSQALQTWKYWYMLLILTFGCFVFGGVVNSILIPQHFFAGGLTGIALLFYDSIQDVLPFSLLYALINIPLFIIGFREFSLKFIITSLIGMGIYTTSLELTQGYEIAIKDPMLAAIFGGVISGFSTGFYLRLGGSVGGLDILGTVIKKRFAIPIGTVFNLVNFVVIFSNAYLHHLETALYTGIFMYVFSWSLQKGQVGLSQRKSIFIISSRPKEVAENVLQKLDRGFTYFHASGGYAGKEKLVIYTVINLLELGRLKEYLFETDPDAFISVQDTGDVIGKRFLTWEEEGYRKRKKENTGFQV